MSDTNLIEKYMNRYSSEDITKGVLATMLEEQLKKNADSITEHLANNGEMPQNDQSKDDSLEVPKEQKREDLEKIIAAGISIAKERKQLPEQIEGKVNTAEEIASNAFDAVTIIETIRKVANGDFSSVGKMSEYMVDMATVKTVVISTELIDKGVDYLRAFTRVAVQAHCGEGTAAFVDYVLDYITPTLSGFIKLGITNLLRKLSLFLKEKISTKINSVNKQKQEEYVTA